MSNIMRTLVRFLAVILFLCGFTVFFMMGAGLGAFAFMDNPPNATEKFFQFYMVFALGGLLTASGAVLWCVAKMAYPTSTQL